MGNFKQLRIWQEGVELAAEIYRVTQCPPLDKDWALKDQLRRAAISIPSNIAEGDELRTNKQAIQYLSIARGSCAELITQLIIAERIGYLTTTERATLEDTCEKIAASINKLIEHRGK